MKQELPFDIFLNIGKQLCDENKNDIILIYIKNTKTYEEYKNHYKMKLKFHIEENKKTINKLNEEINELERKISEIISLYCNKKISSGPLHIFYKNKQKINYLKSLNSLESQKIKYYNLTLQNLKEQHEFYINILEKNYALWDKINNK